MSLNDRILACEMAKWSIYFDRMKSIGKTYENYSDALQEFNFLADKMTEDFCLPIGIAGKKIDDKMQFKVVAKEEEGWDTLMCNAMFAFGDQPCIVKIADTKEGGDA